jgi:hypothetical protein
LAAHGIGAGSLVYLRRVFEGILEKHRKASEEAGDLIADYKDMHVDERIKALEARLPSILVENRKVYGILSKGVHELDEAMCLELFPIVSDAIFMILHKDEEAAADLQRQAELKKRLDDVARKLR